MPTAAPKPCTQCAVLVRDGTARCQAHKVRPGQFGDRRRGTRQERGYGAHWERTRERVLRRDNGVCQCSECKQQGRLRAAGQVDHIINKAAWLKQHGSLQGVDADSNLQSINAECHKAKTAREANAARGYRKV